PRNDVLVAFATRWRRGWRADRPSPPAPLTPRKPAPARLRRDCDIWGDAMDRLLPARAHAKLLEEALIEYVERYGPPERAREALRTRVEDGPPDIWTGIRAVIPGGRV